MVECKNNLVYEKKDERVYVVIRNSITNFESWYMQVIEG